MVQYLPTTECSCGKVHTAAIEEVIIESGALNKLPACIQKYNAKKVFLLADCNTYAAAGEQVCRILKSNAIPCSSYVFDNANLEPDEHAVGSAVMHFDKSCDLLVAVGSGVINDIGKILSGVVRIPYIIVATAPSMDGYASATSSMSMDGLKVSLPSRCADIIIGDIDILKNAPMRMLQAGLGDMLAKYVSICEWRIAHVITGEYYCEQVAQLIRDALKKCTDNAEGLLNRDETAVKAVFEGLVIGGIAMAYAGVSRPASGVEHYFSHIWDMRGLEFGTGVNLHGIQCAIGTLYAAKLYDFIRTQTPDRTSALRYAAAFDRESWNAQLHRFLGKGAEAMIRQEEKEKKYDLTRHEQRLDVIIRNWDQILTIINEELPSARQIGQILETIGVPAAPSASGLDDTILPEIFESTKDIRDKYVLSRLAWDLGLMEPMKALLKK